MDARVGISGGGSDRREIDRREIDQRGQRLCRNGCHGRKKAPKRLQAGRKPPKAIAKAAVAKIFGAAAVDEAPNATVAASADGSELRPAACSRRAGGLARTGAG
eukprot:scaffold15005_cov112-Isochrysis_galbana.AAC.2